MVTYLVTGGAGFIGSNFILHLLATHDEVHVVNVDALTYAGNLENLSSVADDPRYTFVHADIRNRRAMDEVIARYDPTFIVNFAAESHVDRSIENPLPFADTNVVGALTLLEAAKAAWLDGEADASSRRFLQVGTDEVYGTLSLDDPESRFSETTPLNPHSPYSASKASADFFVKAYGDTYGLPVIITRCSNNYGPYQFPEKLIPLMIHNACRHEPLPVYGDGLNVRDWLFVEDHCRAILRVLEAGRLGEVYNVGGSNERANIAIVRLIINECSRLLDDPAINESLITMVADRPGHDRRYAIDAAKIESELGWKPEVTFEEGIRRTIAWYLDHQAWVESVTSGDYQTYYERMYRDR